MYLVEVVFSTAVILLSTRSTILSTVHPRIAMPRYATYDKTRKVATLVIGGGIIVDQPSELKVLCTSGKWEESGNRSMGIWMDVYYSSCINAIILVLVDLRWPQSTAQYSPRLPFTLFHGDSDRLQFAA